MIFTLVSHIFIASRRKRSYAHVHVSATPRVIEIERKQNGVEIYRQVYLLLLLHYLR